MSCSHCAHCKGVQTRARLIAAAKELLAEGKQITFHSVALKARTNASAPSHYFTMEELMKEVARG